MEIADCGSLIRIDDIPTKIVTSNASSLEMLFWLGAQDRVLGTGFPPASGTLPETTTLRAASPGQFTRYRATFRARAVRKDGRRPDRSVGA